MGTSLDFWEQIAAAEAKLGWRSDRKLGGAAEIASWLRSRIRAHSVRPGTPLPDAADMAARFHVCATTVRQATVQLRAEGLVTGDGAGLRVVERVTEWVCGQCGTI